MMQALQMQLLDEWSRSMQCAYRSALQMAEFAAEALDSATLGLSLLRRRRMGVRPTRIRDIGKVRKIIDRARQSGGS